MRACKYLSVFVVILTFSCAAKKDRRDIKEIPEPTVEVREKTAYESQIEKLEGFFAEYENCESYINAVDPSLILRGELPVNVVEMDKVCKPFVSDFRAFDDNFLGALMEYDYTVISLAEAVDDYLILSFKSKRVGVKDRKALKAEIELAKSKSGSSLKAARDGFAALKALGLRDFPEKSYIAGMFGAGESGKGAVDFMNEYVAVVKKYAVEPGFAGEPVYRNFLRKYSVVAEKKVKMMRKTAGVDLKFSADAAELAGALKTAIDFFLGDYFDKLEDKEGKALKKNFEKVVRDWEKQYAGKNK